MAYYRINRISEEIRKEISEIIRTEVKDPADRSRCPAWLELR
jgi:ribosome-binding factor A